MQTKIKLNEPFSFLESPLFAFLFGLIYFTLGNPVYLFFFFLLRLDFTVSDPTIPDAVWFTPHFAGWYPQLRCVECKI